MESLIREAGGQVVNNILQLKNEGPVNKSVVIIEDKGGLPLNYQAMFVEMLRKCVLQSADPARFVERNHLSAPSTSLSSADSFFQQSGRVSEDKENGRVPLLRRSIIFEAAFSSSDEESAPADLEDRAMEKEILNSPAFLGKVSFQTQPLTQLAEDLSIDSQKEEILNSPTRLFSSPRKDSDQQTKDKSQLEGNQCMDELNQQISNLSNENAHQLENQTLNHTTQLEDHPIYQKSSKNFVAATIITDSIQMEAPNSQVRIEISKKPHSSESVCTPQPKSLVIPSAQFTQQPFSSHKDALKNIARIAKLQKQLQDQQLILQSCEPDAETVPSIQRNSDDNQKNSDEPLKNSAQSAAESSSDEYSEALESDPFASYAPPNEQPASKQERVGPASQPAKGIDSLLSEFSFKYPKNFIFYLLHSTSGNISVVRKLLGNWGSLSTLSKGDLPWTEVEDKSVLKSGMIPNSLRRFRSDIEIRKRKRFLLGYNS